VAIYINPMFTYYLIKVAWGGDARVCARVAIAGLPNIMLRGFRNIEEVLLRNTKHTQGVCFKL
jgi:hypothetical protein